jgi:hypothetical protein
VSVVSQDDAEDHAVSDKTPAVVGAAPRKRGRPLEMMPAEVLERIRRLAGAGDGLYRIHHTHSDLYARARRQFGSWATAVAEAGVDYAKALSAARRRARETRRERRRGKDRSR